MCKSCYLYTQRETEWHKYEPGQLFEHHTLRSLQDKIYTLEYNLAQYNQFFKLFENDPELQRMQRKYDKQK